MHCRQAGKTTQSLLQSSLATKKKYIFRQSLTNGHKNQPKHTTKDKNDIIYKTLNIR